MGRSRGTYLGVLVVDEGLLGGEGRAAERDAGQDVDAVGRVDKAVGEVLGVGVVPLGEHAHVGVDEGVDGVGVQAGRVAGDVALGLAVVGLALALGLGLLALALALGPGLAAFAFALAVLFGLTLALALAVVTFAVPTLVLAIVILVLAVVTLLAVVFLILIVAVALALVLAVLVVLIVVGLASADDGRPLYITRQGPSGAHSGVSPAADGTGAE
jgi:hypothetical protein